MTEEDGASETQYCEPIMRASSSRRIHRLVNAVRSVKYRECTEYTGHLTVDQLLVRVEKGVNVYAHWSSDLYKTRTAEPKRLTPEKFSCGWVDPLKLPNLSIYSTNDKYRPCATTLRFITDEQKPTELGHLDIDVSRFVADPSLSQSSVYKISATVPQSVVCLRVELTKTGNDGAAADSNDLLESVHSPIAVIRGDEDTPVDAQSSASCASAKFLKHAVDEHPEPDVAADQEELPWSQTDASSDDRPVGGAEKSQQEEEEISLTDPLRTGLIAEHAGDHQIVTNVALQLIDAILEATPSENRLLFWKDGVQRNRRDNASTAHADGELLGDEAKLWAIDSVIRRTLHYGSCGVLRPSLKHNHNLSPHSSREKVSEASVSDAERVNRKALEEELILTKVKLAQIETDQDHQIADYQRKIRNLELQLEQANHSIEVLEKEITSMKVRKYGSHKKLSLKWNFTPSSRNDSGDFLEMSKI